MDTAKMIRNIAEAGGSCFFCGEPAKNEDEYGKELCDHCFAVRYRGCENCGDLIPDFKMKAVVGFRRNVEYWCPECAKAESSFCIDCGEFVAIHKV